MKISIALCTYNGEKYLLEQLKSIASQTRKPDELVVCDDKSTDTTLDILHSFKEKCGFQVRIYENDSNVGTIRNFEKAIRLCEGDVIALSDQDDVWKTNKLEMIAATFEKNPDVGYVFSDAELVDERLIPFHKRLWKSVGFHRRLYKEFLAGEQYLCLLRQHIVTGATMAFKSSLRSLLFPFPTDTIWIHDGWIALIASAVGKYGLPLPEPLILYRQHTAQQIGVPESVTSATIDMEFLNVKTNLEKLVHYWDASYQFLKERLLYINQNYRIDVATSIKQLEFLEQRKLHFKNRILICSATGLRKIRLIYEEAKSGRYKRFANSWSSIIRDLVL